MADGGSSEKVIIGVEAPVYCNLFMASLKETEKCKVGTITLTRGRGFIFGTDIWEVCCIWKERRTKSRITCPTLFEWSRVQNLEPVLIKLEDECWRCCCCYCDVQTFRFCVDQAVYSYFLGHFVPMYRYL